MFIGNRNAVVLAAALLTFVLGACGGDSGTGGDQTAGESSTAALSPALTKPAFLRQANAVCSQALKEKDQEVQSALKESGQNFAEAPSKELEGVAVKIVFPAYEEAFSELGDLSPPAKDAAAISRIIRTYESELKKAEADPSVTTEVDPFIPANELAVKYGLTNCVF